MNGARMRWYSLSGTRPAATSASVPRLIAPCESAHPHMAGRERRQASRRGFRPAPARRTRAPAPLSSARHTFSLHWTKQPAARYILPGPKGYGSCRSVSGRAASDLAVSAGSDMRIVGRRALFACLTIATIAVLLALAAHALSAGGFGAADAFLLLLFGLTLPWSVIGFWNATIGFFIMRFARDPVAAVLPSVARVRGDEPITASTAITDAASATSRRIASSAISTP